MPSEGAAEGRRDSEFMDQFLANQASIYAYLRALVINCADVEELFQQVALTLWTKRDTFDPDRGNFRGWAIGVARNHLRNFVRHKAVDQRVQVFASDVVDRIAADRERLDEFTQERRQALSSCLGKLAETDRMRLEEYYGGTRKPRQLAADEGVSLRTFYRRVQQIRKMLMDCIIRTMSTEVAPDAR